MARKTKRSSATAEQPPPAIEEDVEMAPEDADDSYKLHFDQPLTWRAGRPIALADLNTRLQTLYAELSKLDQDERNADILTSKAQELAHVQLLAHKDKGVRAWTLLCIVQMFYLLAPNAPYKASQLRDIFGIFANQVIPALADPSDPYSEQYVEILKSLAQSRSIVLIQDIDADALMLQIFQNAFDVVAGNGKNAVDRIPKNTEYQLSSILSDIVEDQQHLPADVIEVILAQFLRADTTISGADAQSTAVSPAYDMARGICNQSISNMAKHVSQWYSSVLVNASETARVRPRGKKRKHDDDEEEDDGTATAAISTEDLQDAEKAHKLLRELWRSAPDVVQGVIPQIEAELSAENVSVRTLAVRAVGDLISGIGAAGMSGQATLDPAAWPSQSLHSHRSSSRNAIAPYSFSKVYPDCYQAFIDRHRDKTSAVRSAWTSSAGNILATNAGGKGLDSDQESTLLQYIKDCLKDNDEKVRLASLEALSGLDYTTLITLFSKDGGLAQPDSLLDNIADRTKDPKPAVRPLAIKLLAKLWGVASAAIIQGDETLRSVVGPIPSRIFDARYINQFDVNYFITQAVHDSLLPYSFPPIKSTTISDSQQADGGATIDPDVIRAERVLLLVSDLTERAERVFFGMQGHRNRKAKLLSAFVEQCDSPDKQNKASKQKLEDYITALAADALNKDTAVQHLKLLAKHSDKRNNHLIQFCLEPKSDYRKVYKAIQELRKRIEGSSQTSATLETLLPLLKSSALLIYNRSNVPTYMHYAIPEDKEQGATANELQEDKGLGLAANKLLKDIAATTPDVFKIHADDLCQTIQATQPSASTPTDPSAVFALKTCMGFAQHKPGDMPKDRSFYQALMAYALYGSPPQTAKYAVSIIKAASPTKELHIDIILTDALRGFKYGQPHFLARLAAIAQIELLSHKDIEDHSETITSIAVQKVLQTSRTLPSDDDPDWPLSTDLDMDLTAKLLAIKILVNGLRGRDPTKESEDDIASLRLAALPVYRLLNTLIARGGELTKTGTTPKHHKSKLRLTAGVSLLKLCSDRRLDSFLSQADFNRLAQLCQDSIEDVRSNFGSALRKYLGRGKLPSRFTALTFLYAHEPNKKVKGSMETWLRARAAASVKDGEKKDTVMENVFARLLSLLTHHPDFTPDEEDLKATVVYIVFYLANVASEQNLPILYNIAQRVKTVQDGIDVDKSEHLYLVSDLAEATIRAYHEEKGWTFEPISENIRLPPGIFRQLPRDINLREMADKRYLSEDVLDEIPALVRSCLRTRKKRADRTSTTKRVKDLDSSVVKADKPKRQPQSRKRLSGSETPEPKARKKTKSSPPDEADDGNRRRSSRNGNATNKSYVEMDSDEEDEELEKWNVEDDKENHDASEDTPPTSEPALEAEDAAQVTPPQKAPKRGALKATKTKDIRAGTRTSSRRAA